MHYNCTKIWPLPRNCPFTHGLAIAKDKIASFEASTMTSRMAFLQDLKIIGQKAIALSAWLEMVHEALSVLFARSTKDIHILKSIVFGTTEDMKRSHDKIHCSIDMLSGVASVVDASGNHLSAEITHYTGAVSGMTKHRAPFLKSLIKAPTHVAVGSPRKSHFARAIVAKEALDFIVHPGLLQSSLTLHHLALAAQHQCASVSFVSCATIVMEDICNKRCCPDVPSNVSMCEHRCQGLKCTNMHGQAFFQLFGMQMRLEDKPSTSTSNFPTLSLKWQPLAMSTSTQNTLTNAKPLRWVILGEIPCNVGDLCYKVDQHVIATTIQLDLRGCRYPSEMHIDNEEDMVYFLSTVKADNCLLVQSLHGKDCWEEKSSAEAAMLWVFRAYARSPTTFKMNLVTREERQCNRSPGLTLCQGREFQYQPRLVTYGHLRQMQGLPFISPYCDLPI